MSVRMRQLDWARGYVQRGEGLVPGTQTAIYRMTDLIKRGLIPAAEGRAMLLDTGLLDFVWEVTWAGDETPDEALSETVGDTQGYAIFVHGWTGNHTIWESLPGMVVRGNPRLVAISIDHNGFGDSLFEDDTPALDTCNPPAAMRALERFIDVLRLRRQPGDPQPRVINIIGHSMGGATLFYPNVVNWRFAELTRYAIAPALLLEDELHRAFFTTLGIGIGIVNRLRAFEIIERAIKPNVVEAVAAGASSYVRRAHARQYEATPRGVTAATFVAMGLLNNREIPHNFEFCRVMLGHRDTLVGLVPMMDLLAKLEFPAGHIRVVAGSHYLFSVGAEAVFQHAQNRELVVEDVLELHERAYRRQQQGHRVG